MSRWVGPATATPLGLRRCLAVPREQLGTSPEVLIVDGVAWRVAAVIDDPASAALVLTLFLPRPQPPATVWPLAAERLDRLTTPTGTFLRTRLLIAAADLGAVTDWTPWQSAS